MDKKKIDKLADSEAEVLEQEVQQTYATRIGVKQMIKRGILRFAKKMNKENG